jgi:hypothetical protein
MAITTSSSTSVNAVRLLTTGSSTSVNAVRRHLLSTGISTSVNAVPRHGGPTCSSLVADVRRRNGITGQALVCNNRSPVANRSVAPAGECPQAAVDTNATAGLRPHSPPTGLSIPGFVRKASDATRFHRCLTVRPTCETLPVAPKRANRQGSGPPLSGHIPCDGRQKNVCNLAQKIIDRRGSFGRLVVWRWAGHRDPPRHTGPPCNEPLRFPADRKLEPSISLVTKGTGMGGRRATIRVSFFLHALLTPR